MKRIYKQYEDEHQARGSELRAELDELATALGIPILAQTVPLKRACLREAAVAVAALALDGVFLTVAVESQANAKGSWKGEVYACETGDPRSNAQIALAGPLAEVAHFGRATPAHRDLWMLRKLMKRHDWSRRSVSRLAQDASKLLAKSRAATERVAQALAARRPHVLYFHEVRPTAGFGRDSEFESITRDVQAVALHAQRERFSSAV